MPPRGNRRCSMNASSPVAMTSTIASPIATMSREDLTRGWLAARLRERQSEAVIPALSRDPPSEYCQKSRQPPDQVRGDGHCKSSRTRYPLSNDRPAALHPAFALRFVDLLRGHGVHRGRAGQQAGGAWAAGGRGWNLCLSVAGRDFELGRRAAWPAGGESSGADRLRAPDRVAAAERRGARPSGLAGTGSGAARGLQNRDGRDSAHLDWRDHRLRDFDLPQRYDFQPPEGA